MNTKYRENSDISHFEILFGDTFSAFFLMSAYFLCILFVFGLSRSLAFGFFLPHFSMNLYFPCGLLVRMHLPLFERYSFILMKVNKNKM